VLVIEFTMALAQMLPEEFVHLLLRRHRIRELWVGSDFALGRNRTGTPDKLAEIGRVEGFEVRPFDRVERFGAPVSSSRIRGLLVEGRVEETAQLLGRPYRLSGVVGQGDRRGRTLGFATANLTQMDNLCVPGNGVYAVWGRTRAGLVYPCVTNVGIHPTFGGTARQVEVHLLDFEGNLYGDSLNVDFVGRLRDELRFDSVEELIGQMKSDVVDARQLLAGTPPVA
ncbi:MAG TPA: riboflavin kinase, partial [Chloroflexota bacterium]|nr:riboflavin kinase [Chloroflexota bacterium]